MIYKSSRDDLDSTLDSVKYMLRKMGNIKGFKSFFGKEHTYYEVIDGKKEYYNLILFDDEGNEFWIDSNCGYPGTGPSYTEKILQLVGARDEYRVCKDKKIYIPDLKLNHNLNLLIVEQNYLNACDRDKYKVRAMIEVKFKSAYQRYKLIESLNILGSLTKALQRDDRFYKYFNGYNIDNSCGEYNVNQIMFLDICLVDKEIDFITKLFKHIIGLYCSDINIIEIDEIVEDICYCNN
ncbi:MAG: hypothetical protein IJ086_07220 [Clostridium sp.]|nr:hypothetical protein [Clostridium sp.]